MEETSLVPDLCCLDSLILMSCLCWAQHNIAVRVEFVCPTLDGDVKHFDDLKLEGMMHDDIKTMMKTLALKAEMENT